MMFFHQQLASALPHQHHQFVPSISPLFFDTLGTGGGSSSVITTALTPTAAAQHRKLFYGGLSHETIDEQMMFFHQLVSALPHQHHQFVPSISPLFFDTLGTGGGACSSPLIATTLTPTAAAQHRKLFIGGLSHETTDEQLGDFYSKWGKVIDCIVIRDPITRQSRGFGFVTYATIEMADAAMADRPHTIAGKVVDPKRAIPREQMLQATSCPPAFLDVEPPSECKLCLSGITNLTVDILRHFFERFGELEQVEIVGHTGNGFIVFEKRSSADKCLAHGRQHIINGRKVEIVRQGEHRIKPKSPPT